MVKQALFSHKHTCSFNRAMCYTCWINKYQKLIFFCVFSLLQAISFLSDLGGILGLWFGFAMFSFFEFFEFVVDIIVLAARKVLMTRKKSE